jgi:hypothetical protein
LPGPGDDVVIDLPDNFSVTHSLDTTSIHSLQSEKAVVLSGGSLALAASSLINTFNINGTLTATSFTMTGGTVNGKGGTLQADFYGVAGDLYPGGSENDEVGTFTINGNYFQTAAAVLHIRLKSASDYDQLVINGNATVAGGILWVSLLDDFVPSLVTPEVFDIITADSMTASGFALTIGVFIPLPLPPRELYPIFFASGLVLVTGPPEP